MDLGVVYVDKVFLHSVLILLALMIVYSLVTYCVIKKGVKDALVEYNNEKKTLEEPSE